jgi:hypothetical protein
MKFKIKGVAWKLRVLPVDVYHKYHGKDSHGVTVFHDHRIDVEVGSLTLNTICHELGHAYFSSCMTDSADLSSIATEEIFCEILGNHGTELINLGRRILRNLLPEANKWR